MSAFRLLYLNINYPSVFVTMPKQLLRRLEALRNYGVLDTQPEAFFDNVVEQAIAACRTPMGLISFIDEDRQWFKAERGMGTRQTDLDCSICAKAIEHEGLFVVPNAELDPRVNANPLVYGKPGIRFYAGAPLVTPDGVAIGMVCVLDVETRPLGLQTHQGLLLQHLAEAVMTHLNRQRAS